MVSNLDVAVLVFLVGVGVHMVHVFRTWELRKALRDAQMTMREAGLLAAEVTLARTTPRPYTVLAVGLAVGLAAWWRWLSGASVMSADRFRLAIVVFSMIVFVTVAWAAQWRYLIVGVSGGTDTLLRFNRFTGAQQVYACHRPSTSDAGWGNLYAVLSYSCAWQSR